jgi:hypothetical protein
VTVPPHRFGEVGDQDRRGIDDGVAVYFGVLALDVGDPGGGQLEDRFHGGRAHEVDLAVGGIHGEPVTRHQLSFGHRVSLQQESILVGRQLQVVPQPNGRHEQTHLLSKRSSHAGHSFQEISPLAGVCQAKQSVAQFDLEGIQSQQGFQLFGFATYGRPRAARDWRGRVAGCGPCPFRIHPKEVRIGPGLGFSQGARDHERGSGQQQKGEARHAGDEGEEGHHAGQDQHGPRVKEQLAA